MLRVSVSCVVGVGALVAGLFPLVVRAQEPASAALAEELAGLMTNAQLDALAARDTIDEDRFVAALHFPGQLLVVSARYEVPVAVERKIAGGEHREVYIDLNAASIAGTKILITDSGANGLRGEDETVDMFDNAGEVLRLDGDGSGGALSDDEYRTAVADAERQYARMLQALIDGVP